MPDTTFEDQLHAAICATMSEPSGRLAMAWAMNLRLNKSIDVNDPLVAGDPYISAYREGIRRAGQMKLDYLRMFLHPEYQTLMADLLAMQNQEHLLDMENQNPLKEET
jgi:hypothetical protein